MPTLLDRRRLICLAVAVFAGLCHAASLHAEPAMSKLLSAPIKRQRVDSTSIESVGYETRLNVLEVKFRSGALYRYVAVPPAVFQAFLKAGSKGRYFTRQIRNRYEFHRLEEPRP
jgi:hypothetical protein